MATDHTKQYGEFDSVKRDDAPEVAADKATDILNNGNGDVHGVEVDQKTLDPEADQAGTEEYRNPFGTEAFKVNHQDQAGLLAINAGANANTHGDARKQALADQKEANRQNSMVRMSMLSSLYGLSLAQEAALSRFSDFARGLRQSQQEIEAAATTVEELRAERDQILESETNPVIRERIDAHYQERIAAGNQVWADTLEGREDRVRNFMEAGPGVEGSFANIALEFAEGDTPEEQMQHVTDMRENVLQFLDTQDEQYLTDLPPALRAQVAQELSGIEFSPEELQSFDTGNLTLADAMAARGVTPSEAIPQTRYAIEAAAEARGAGVCGVTQEDLALSASQMENGEWNTPVAANITSAPSSERAASAPAFVDPLAPQGSVSTEVTDLTEPSQFASVSGMMDVPNSFGAGRMMTVYPNGTISDGPFQDARTGNVTQPGTPGTQPAPGMGVTNDPNNPSSPTFRDPLTERMERGPGMDIAMASGF